jgi:hypothetical protein
VLRLEKEQRKATKASEIRQRFRMFATCPPSTSIFLRGGQVWDNWSQLYFQSDLTLDLASFAITGREPIFTNAYWYAFYWLGKPLDDDDRLRVGGSTTGTTWWEEYETAVEAEQAALADNCNQLHTYPPWDWGIPIGCVILRNNGDTALPNQFQVVDSINRGHSYIFQTHNNLATRNVM